MLMQNNDSNSQDKAFQNLLSGYAEPMTDNGFSQTVLQSIDIMELQATQTRQVKLRLYSLYGAAFLGGIIASLQFPALMDVLGRFTFTSSDIANASPNLSLISIALALGIALWTMLDSKTSDIF